MTLLRRLAQGRVRARALAVVESSCWLTTGAGARLAPPGVTLAWRRRRAASRRNPGSGADKNLAPRRVAIRVAAQHARV